jgi:hypothetical protein
MVFRQGLQAQMNGALIAVFAFLVVGSAFGQSPEPAKIRITTWNLEWFPNGSPHDATPEKHVQRVEAEANVLRKLDPVGAATTSRHFRAVPQ